MSRPDFVQEVLDYLDDRLVGYGNAGYGLFGYGYTSLDDIPAVLVDGDEMRINSDDSRARDTDVVNTNIITADSSPQATNTPIGTEYDHKIRSGVGVQIEGYHQDGGGQLTDKDAFNDLVTATRSAILSEREFPVGDITHLTIEQENDESPAESHNDANYFRYLFDVWFEGFESLP